MDREDEYIAFWKEYEKLCNKYDVEIAQYDVWDTGDSSLQLYDRKNKVYYLECQF